ncbi:MAG: DegV family protein [Clostridia bacterium]|nr:DegV family protein [Clostridia bacterium]
MTKFQLSCESTVDMPFSYVSGRDIAVAFYTYTIDGEVYVDDMCRDPEALPNFHKMLREGKMPQTSQINHYTYLEYFEELLKKGDVLHLAFGRGMSASVVNAINAANELREQYPDRKIIVVDTLASASGYGMLVDYAADMRDNGSSMEEIEKWVLDNRMNVHHQIYATDLFHLKRGGRVSGPAAMIGTVLGICPIMRLNDKGSIDAYGKVRSKKKAMAETVKAMEEHVQNGYDYDGKCFICHADCIDDANTVKAMIEEKFKNVDVKIFDIGTIIASHTGQGTLALFFMGDDRSQFYK